MPRTQPQYNAQTLPLGDPYTAASNYNVRLDNAHERLDTLWDHRNEKAGGSRQIYQKLQQWASPEKIRERGGNPNDAQWRYWQDYFRTGTVNPNMRADTILRGLGTGLSETARHQQHKQSFLDTPFGRILGTLGTLATAAIPVVGPYAAAGVGGYLGQRNGGNILGGVLGAAGGYLTGNAIANAGGITNVINNARNSVGNLFNSGGFSNPSALGITGLPGVEFSSMPGAFPSTLSAAGQGAAALGPASVGLNFASGAMPGLLATNLDSVSHVANSLGGDPSSLYRPESAGPVAGGSTRSPFTTAGRIVNAANSLASGGQPMPTGAPGGMHGGSFGAPRQMVPHGAMLRPITPLYYPDSPFNSNPFMARIV